MNWHAGTFVSSFLVCIDDVELSGYGGVSWWFIVGWQKFVESEVLTDVWTYILLMTDTTAHRKQKQSYFYTDFILKKCSLFF